VSFKIIKRYRRENPEFDRFVAAAIADSLVVGQRIRHRRRLNAAKGGDQRLSQHSRDAAGELSG
jgi:hypothetical protein